LLLLSELPTNTVNTNNIIHYKTFFYQHNHDHQLPTSFPILCFIKLLAILVLDLTTAYNW